jgi:hypothetical protein
MTMPKTKIWLYRYSLCFAFLIFVTHVVALPLRVPYDGLGYIDLADVLFSGRFPKNWYPSRTPLFPLSLKASFWLLGRQPHAAILVTSTAALAGILLLGAAVRRLAGESVASLAVILVSMFPVLIVYQHSVLTEAGTFFFIAMILYLLLWPGRGRNSSWCKAAGLAAVLGAGYYWRQNVMVLTPVAAFFHWCGARNASGSHSSAQAAHGRAGLASLSQAALIAVVPVLLSSFWNPYLDQKGLRDVTLKQGMLRQALLPPEHPYVGEYREAYFDAIRASLYEGNFYSGTRMELLASLSEKIYSRPMDRPVPAFFLDLVVHYPGRYLSGLGRTLIFFAGGNGAESDNRIGRDEVLSPGSKISGGPEPLRSRIEKDFQQRPAPAALLHLFRRIGPYYDCWLIVAHAITAVGVLLALLWRDLRLSICCGVPAVYTLGYAVLLVSLDRFVAPVYPIVIVNGFLVPLLAWRRLKERLGPAGEGGLGQRVRKVRGQQV